MLIELIITNIVLKYFLASNKKMIQLKPASIVSQSQDQVAKKLDEATIIMSIEEGKYFNLNRVASRVWEMIEEPKTLEQIADQLLSEYEISPEDCIRDVSELISELKDLGLVVVT